MMLPRTERETTRIPSSSGLMRPFVVVPTPVMDLMPDMALLAGRVGEGGCERIGVEGHGSREPPREMVSMAAQFEGSTGRYMYHCHILEHEDHEMMRPFVVVPAPVMDLMPDMAMLDGMGGHGGHGGGMKGG